MKRAKPYIISLLLFFSTSVSAFAGEIDPAKFIKDLGFREYTHLEEVRKEIPTDPVSSYNHYWWRDEQSYRVIKKVYEAVKDLKKEDFGRCADGIMIGALSIEELMKFKDKARVYLANREKALKRYSEAQQRLEKERQAKIDAKEEKRKKRQEAEARRLKQQAIEEEERARQWKLKKEKEKREAPQQIVAQFKNSPRPSNFEEIKKMVSRVHDWKVKVIKLSVGWEVFNYSDGLDRTLAQSESVVFRSLPMDASSYRNKFLLIEASVDRRFDSDYVLTDSSGREALGVISKKTIERSGIQFKTSAYMCCRLVDIVNVQTVGGTTKPIAKVKVDGIIKWGDYKAFANYVLGHPNEFPQNKYVKISDF